jgi:riboflavin kinase/FMN adenylyltransferase
MDLYRTIQSFPDSAKGCVVVIGNFDGVHRGHKILLETARKIADQKGSKLAVLTFEPHPRRLFRPDDPPFRITPAALKREKISACGVDIMLELSFDWDFASQSAEHFIDTILKDTLGAAHIVVGYDFCFGQLRKGNPDTIRASGLEVTTLDKVRDDGDSALSSSRVRQALRQGDLAAANDILGWSWELRGEIVKGDQRGRELGYPTANMGLGDCVHPAYGVYAVLARIESDGECEGKSEGEGAKGWLKGAANIGIRPMFEVPSAQVETYLFDFDREIYGKTLCVRPIKRLRGEAKFHSLEALIAQMDEDCKQARDVLLHHG